MLVIVASALAMLIVVVVMMLVVVMVVVLVHLLFKLRKSVLKSVLFLHCCEDLLAVKLIRGGGDYYGIGIEFSQKRNGIGNLVVARFVGMRKENSRCVRYLVVIKLTEVLRIHLALSGICHRGEAIKNGIRRVKLLHRLYNIGELAYARGLYYYSVGIVILKHLFKRLGKIAHKRAADTTGIHLRYLYARILKESSVDSDLSEFIFYKYNLFLGVRFFYKLLYKCCFSGSEKSGKYIYFGHFYSPSSFILFQPTYILLHAPRKVKQQAVNF